MVDLALIFAYSTLFGDFTQKDDIDTLVFIGKTSKDGLVTYPALAALGAYLAGWICYAQLGIYTRMRTRAAVKVATKELDVMEAAWKERWLRELEQEDEPKAIQTCESGSPHLDICDFPGNHVKV